MNEVEKTFFINLGPEHENVLFEDIWKMSDKFNDEQSAVVNRPKDYIATMQVAIKTKYRVADAE